jgi:hypothetical protein
MKIFNRVVPSLLVLLFLVGCASSTITARQEYQGEKIARPDHIIIYDFAATSSDMPADSGIAGQYSEHAASQTQEHIATGRQVGATIVQQLVEEIRGMGLPAERGSNRTEPRTGDLVIRGYLVSVDEGSAAERIAIGFGSGASELKATAEGFLMTDRGLRKLGSGTVDAGGSKSPGAALGVVGAVATANPAGLIISSGMKVYGEASGSSTIEGRAKQMAEEIAKILRVKFEEQGWI